MRRVLTIFGCALLLSACGSPLPREAEAEPPQTSKPAPAGTIGVAGGVAAVRNPKADSGRSASPTADLQPAQGRRVGVWQPPSGSSTSADLA